jgi:hypothetical protein
MVDQLVEVVGERVGGVGALVELEQHVADRGVGRGAVACDGEGDAVLPLDLVADVVLVPGVGRIGHGKHLAGVAERDVAHLGEEMRSVRVAAVLMAEAAAARTGGRVPRGVRPAVGADDGEGVVLFLGAAVMRAGVPAVHGAAGRDPGGVEHAVGLGAGGEGERGGGGGEDDGAHAKRYEGGGEPASTTLGGGGMTTWGLQVVPGTLGGRRAVYL